MTESSKTVAPVAGYARRDAIFRRKKAAAYAHARKPVSGAMVTVQVREFGLDLHSVSSGMVLIASAEHLPALQQRPEFADAQAFSDADALRALDIITRQRPGVVALERLFAATSRGAALINRIKADPTLADCEVRIVAHDSNYSRVSPRRPGDPAVAVEEPVPAAQPTPQLDWKGTRRAPRFKIVQGVDVLIDGNPATLMDLSVIGAMVVSPTTLKPNQRIRMSLPQEPRPIRFSAGVAWAAFEMPKGNPAPHYKAGIEFFDADADAVLKFIDVKKR
jgi:hypothetical protein